MVDFDKSDYLNSVNIKGFFGDERQIYKLVRQSRKFQYGDVGYEKFSANYTSSSGWLGRKVVALPEAVLCGTGKTIYHFLKAIATIPVERKLFRVKLYYLARDLQESFGWLVSLFNDRYGQFHIQESRFHKSCYDCVLEKRPVKRDYVQEARKHLQEGSIEDALGAIKHIKDEKVKAEFLIKAANICFDRGDLEDAYSALSLIEFGEYEELKKPLLADLAEEFYSKGDRDNFYKTLLLAYGSIPSMNPLRKKVAEEYFNSGSLDEALTVIGGLVGECDFRSEFVEKVIEGYLSQEKFDKAISTAEYEENIEKQKYWKRKIAITLMDKGERPKAFSIIQLMGGDVELYMKLSESYFIANDFDRATRMIGLMYMYPVMQKKALEKFIDAIIEKGEPEIAFYAFKEVHTNYETAKKLAAKIAQSYIVNNDKEGALKVLRETVTRSLEHMAKIFGKSEAFRKTAWGSVKNKDKLGKFYAEWALKFYEAFRETLVSDPRKAADEIENMFLSEEVLEKFFNLIPEESYAREPKREYAAPSAEDYETLGLKKGASLQEVRKAYLKLALKYHPDKVKDPDSREKAEEYFKKIGNAYQAVAESLKS